MKHPTAGEYQEAVQIPGAAFADPILQEAEPETTVLGLPQAITGAFAVVFPMRSRGARWAVKCFLTDVPDQRERYRAVARRLAEAGLPQLVAFDYQPKGIRVRGMELPLLKMEWVDGISIARFLEAHVEHSVERTTKRTNPPAHSDEAGGPALTTAGRTDVLPAAGHPLRRLHENWRQLIRELEASGIAHGDLQHGNVLVDAEANVRLVDYDTMYVPALRGKRSAEVGHRNFQHPDRDESDFGPHIDRFSALVIDTTILACIHLPDLWSRYSTGENLLFRASDFFDPETSPLFDELALAQGELRTQVEVLRQACRGEPEDVPSLAAVAAGEAAGPRAVASPFWRRPRGLVRSARQRGGDRAADRRLPDHRRRSAFERRYAPVAAAIAAAAAMLIATGLYAAAAELLVTAAAAGLLWTYWRYRRLPDVRRCHRLQKEETYFFRLITTLEEEFARLENVRSTFVAQMDAEYERRLEDIRESALRDQLKHHFVAEAGTFDGITHKVVVRLKLEGIRTAYQATAERMAGIRQLSDESKARIGLWRAALAAQYASEIPRELSPADERRVRRAIEVRLEEMDAEMSRIQKKIDVQIEERDQVRKRMNETSDIRFVNYVLYLLRIRNSANPQAS